MAAERQFILKFLGDVSGASKSADELNGRFSNLQKTIGAVTAAGVALGVGLETLARKQQENTRAVNRLTELTGLHRSEVRDLAADLHDVTFPMEEVLALLELGAKRELKSREELERYANTWDLVGDATGKSGPRLAEAAVGLSQLGIDAHNSEEALDALGFVTTRTTGGVEDFLALIERRGPAIAEYGLDINATAAFMALLEERGLTGRVAQQEFEKALNSSDGTMQDLLRTLNLSQEEFDAMRGQVEGSEESLHRLAAANNDVFTNMEKLQAKVSELTFRFGGQIQTAAQLAPALIALGPAMAGVTMATRALSVAMAFLAANPIGLVLVALAALVVAAILLWRNWDVVKEKAAALGTFLSQTFGRIARWIGEKVDQIMAFMGPFVFLLGPLGLILTAIQFRDDIAAAFGWMKDRIGEAIGGITGFIEGMAEAFERVWRRIQEVVRRITSAVQEARDAIAGLPGAGIITGGIVNAVPGGGIISGAAGLFGRAHGGPVHAGRAYVVGEAGPELFVPHRSGTIVPHHESARGRSPGGNHYSITVHAPDPQTAAEYVLRAIRKLEDRGSMQAVTT